MKKKWGEQTLDESAAGFASGAVRHLDLRFAKADLGEHVRFRQRFHATDAMLVTIAVLRCS